MWLVCSSLIVPVERPVINKERLAGYYRLSAYYLSKTFSEVPLVLIQPAVFFTIVFLMSGINYNIVQYFALLGLILMTVVAAHVSSVTLVVID